VEQLVVPAQIVPDQSHSLIAQQFLQPVQISGSFTQVPDLRKRVQQRLQEVICIGSDELLTDRKDPGGSRAIALLVEQSLFASTLARLILCIDGGQAHDAAAGMRLVEPGSGLEHIHVRADGVTPLRQGFHRPIQVLMRGALGRIEDLAKLLDTPVSSFPPREHGGEQLASVYPVALASGHRRQLDETACVLPTLHHLIIGAHYLT
jgi:hypothetical protein